MDVLPILEKFRDILEVTNIFTYGIRELGWLTIKGLMWCVDGVESVTDKVLTLNDFFNYDAISKLLVKFRPVLWVLLGISIIFIGYQLIFNKLKDRSSIVFNIILTITFVLILPQLMVKLNGITTDGINAISDSQKANSSAQIVKENLADVYYYAQKDFKLQSPSKGYVNMLPLDKIKYLDITETIDPDDKNIKNDVLKYKVATDVKGNPTEVELDSGWFGIGDESYYRWKMNFIIIIVSLVTTLIALVVTVVKAGRIMFELAFNKIFGSIVAVTDLSSGQRTKQILSHILSSFAVLFFIALLLKIYIFYSGWISTVDSKIGSFGSLLLLVAGSFALIDGPNIVERILGIDAGLKSGWQTLAGGYFGVKAVAGGLKGAKNTVANAAGKMGGFVSGATGMAKGISNGIKQSEVPSMKDMKGGVNPSSNPSTELSSGTSQINQNDQSMDNPENSGSIPNNTNVNSLNDTQPINSTNSMNRKNHNQPNMPINTNGQNGNKSNVPISQNRMSNNHPNIPVSQNGMSSNHPNVPVNSNMRNNQANGKAANKPIEPGIRQHNLNNNIGTSTPIFDQHGNTLSSVSPMNDSQAKSESNSFSPLNEQLNTNISPAQSNGVKTEANSSLNPGHIVPQHQYTLGGQNRFRQRMKETHAKAHNTGYNIGQSLRKGNDFIKGKSLTSSPNSSQHLKDVLNIGNKREE